jgi:prepilin-type N-terminal cleavage/methylation domain-containing protein
MERKGFTLIELLVVLAIIAAVAALIIPKVVQIARGQETPTEVWHIQRGEKGNVISETRVQ